MAKIPLKSDPNVYYDSDTKKFYHANDSKNFYTQKNPSFTGSINDSYNQAKNRASHLMNSSEVTDPKLISKYKDDANVSMHTISNVDKTTPNYNVKGDGNPYKSKYEIEESKKSFNQEPTWAEKMDDNVRNIANNELDKWKDSLPKNAAPTTKKILPTVSKTTTDQPKINSSMDPAKVERTELKSSENTPKQVAEQKEFSPVAKDNTKSNMEPSMNNGSIAINSSPYLRSGKWGTGGYNTENAFGFQRSPWSGGGRLDPNINESFSKFMAERNRSKLGGPTTTDNTSENVEQKATDNKMKEMTPVKPTLNTMDSNVEPMNIDRSNNYKQKPLTPEEDSIQSQNLMKSNMNPVRPNMNTSTEVEQGTIDRGSNRSYTPPKAESDSIEEFKNQLPKNVQKTSILSTTNEANKTRKYADVINYVNTAAENNLKNFKKTDFDKVFEEAKIKWKLTDEELKEIKKLAE